MQLLDDILLLTNDSQKLTLLSNQVKSQHERQITILKPFWEQIKRGALAQKKSMKMAIANTIVSLQRLVELDAATACDESMSLDHFVYLFDALISDQESSIRLQTIKSLYALASEQFFSKSITTVLHVAYTLLQYMTDDNQDVCYEIQRFFTLTNDLQIFSNQNLDICVSHNQPPENLCFLENVNQLAHLENPNECNTNIEHATHPLDIGPYLAAMLVLDSLRMSYRCQYKIDMSVVLPQCTSIVRSWIGFAKLHPSISAIALEKCEGNWYKIVINLFDDRSLATFKGIGRPCILLDALVWLFSVDPQAMKKEVEELSILVSKSTGDYGFRECSSFISTASQLPHTIVEEEVVIVEQKLIQILTTCVGKRGNSTMQTAYDRTSSANANKQCDSDDESTEDFLVDHWFAKSMIGSNLWKNNDELSANEDVNLSKRLRYAATHVFECIMKAFIQLKESHDREDAEFFVSTVCNQLHIGQQWINFITDPSHEMGACLPKQLSSDMEMFLNNLAPMCLRLLDQFIRSSCLQNSKTLCDESIYSILSTLSAFLPLKCQEIEQINKCKLIAHRNSLLVLQPQPHNPLIYATNLSYPVLLSLVPLSTNILATVRSTCPWISNDISLLAWQIIESLGAMQDKDAIEVIHWAMPELLIFFRDRMLDKESQTQDPFNGPQKKSWLRQSWLLDPSVTYSLFWVMCTISKSLSRNHYPQNFDESGLMDLRSHDCKTIDRNKTHFSTREYENGFVHEMGELLPYILPLLHDFRTCNQYLSLILLFDMMLSYPRSDSQYWADILWEGFRPLTVSLNLTIQTHAWECTTLLSLLSDSCHTSRIPVQQFSSTIMNNMKAIRLFMCQSSCGKGYNDNCLLDNISEKNLVGQDQESTTDVKSGEEITTRKIDTMKSFSGVKEQEITKSEVTTAIFVDALKCFRGSIPNRIHSVIPEIMRSLQRVMNSHTSEAMTTAVSLLTCMKALIRGISLQSSRYLKNILAIVFSVINNTETCTPVVQHAIELLQYAQICCWPRIFHHADAIFAHIIKAFIKYSEECKVDAVLTRETLQQCREHILEDLIVATNLLFCMQTSEWVLKSLRDVRDVANETENPHIATYLALISSLHPTM